MEIQNKNPKTLVIGLGNPLNPSDAFGPRVIDRLCRNYPDELRGADLMKAHTDLLGQIDRFPAYEQVVLIDTIFDPDQNLGPGGRIIFLNEEALLSWPAPAPDIHRLSPLLAVRLFRNLFPDATSRIFLVGLCWDRIGTGLATGERLMTDAMIDEAAGLVAQRLTGTKYQKY